MIMYLALFTLSTYSLLSLINNSFIMLVASTNKLFRFLEAFNKPEIKLFFYLSLIAPQPYHLILTLIIQNIINFHVDDSSILHFDL